MKRTILLLLILCSLPFSVCALENSASSDEAVEIRNIQENIEEKRVMGTTDVTDTGVKEYFIVLFLCVIVAYGIMFAVKKKDLFKRI